MPTEAIGVYARVKPLTTEDRGDVTVIKRFEQQKSIQVRNLEFPLDWIFDEDAPQDSIYEQTARERIASVMQGFNSTIMAYGQTGSGKTHTMFGPDSVLHSFATVDPEVLGIVPRACNQIFEELAARPVDAEFIVQCSYVEGYNDAINDVLGGKQNLSLRELPGKGMTIEGLTTEHLGSTEEAMGCLGSVCMQAVVTRQHRRATAARTA